MILDAVLVFDGGYLRTLKPEDVHSGYVSGLNDHAVNKYLDGVKRTEQTTRGVVEFIRNNREATDSVLWGIWESDSNVNCGSIRLHAIDHFHKTAVIGICLFNKSSWGKGLGSKTIRTVTQWAQNSIGLRWIEAGVYADNIASQKTFLSAGYELAYEISGKYLLEDRSAVVKMYVAKVAPK